MTMAHENQHPLCALQRGRAPESAEIKQHPRRRRASCCFNGAALRRARRSEFADSNSVAEAELQRGRAPESAEISERQRRPSSR